MDRRRFIASSVCVALLTSVAAAREADAGPEAWLKRWIDAFNSTNPRTYREFISKYLPSAVDYVDDDFALREASGGFKLLRWERTGPQEATGWVKDRDWDRFSRIVLSVDAKGDIADVGFMGAPHPAGFSVARQGEHACLEALARKLKEEADRGRFSGAVLVAKNGRVLFERTYGRPGQGQAIRATPATRFCVGSMGKMFTAVSVLQLIQAGRLQLSEPLSKLLPDYPNKDLARRVTIEHLLTHTGGTGDIFGPHYDGHQDNIRTPGDFIKLYGDRSLAFEPGSRWAYSNYGFILLGAVIERLSERPYDAWYQDHIFRPAGMTATSQAAATPYSSATAYTGSEASGLRPLAPYVGAPAGGGYSTVQDLFAFAAALHSGVLLDRKRLDMASTQRVKAGGGGFGLGFEIKKRNGANCWGHGGAAPGVNGDLAIYPASGYTTVVLCNRGYPAALNAAEYAGFRLPAV